MPIILRENQYRGVNAHLHSYLQGTVGGWAVFHAAHVHDIYKALDRQLPPGYEVSLEESLQVREFHPDTGERIRHPRPDIAVYDTTPRATQTGGGTGVATAPTMTFPAVDMLKDRESYMTAVLIHDARSGVLVTRIELLSPTNKPTGEGFFLYVDKRDSTLRSGTALIEIDYLHESPPVIRRLPSYPDRHPGAYPYTLVVTDPRPRLEEGQARVYGFDVDDPIPIIQIPLSGDEALSFDFGAVYQETFDSRYFRSRVDYAQEPERFESYSQADRERIRARMAAVMAEHAPS